MKTSKYRWAILALLTLAMMVNYMDRAALSVAIPFITKDFHLTAAEKGLIFSCFFIGYAAFNFIGGYLSDRFGPKSVFTWSMVIWSLLCGATAGVFNFWSLLTARVLFGLGEGPVSAISNKTINNWFPVRERARAIGINQAGGPIGGALAGPVVGLLALWLGWRTAFVIIAVLGLLWALVWHRMSRDLPAQSEHVSPAELQLINAERPSVAATSSAEKVSLLTIITQREVLVTGGALFCYNYILFFFMTWFPSYLIDARGVSLKEMSFFSALPWLMGALGFLCGGWLIDTLYRITGKLLFSRKVVLVCSLLTSSLCIGVVGLIDDTMQIVAVMTLAIGALMLAGPGFWALIQDSVAPSRMGTAGGFMHMLSNLSGIIAPAATGFIIQSAKTYTGGFVLAAVLGLVGALVIVIFIHQRPSSAMPVVKPA
ncbi:MFS transporter [Herbaspirillum sp. NPDC087042]|uniref:MFS transporter n=1 Tax=Herbaspirillum sp. NPDC087042 TaxID=3364004 RepID=UPI0038063367